jgi:hypothetical protein
MSGSLDYKLNDTSGGEPQQLVSGTCSHLNRNVCAMHNATY